MDLPVKDVIHQIGSANSSLLNEPQRLFFCCYWHIYFNIKVLQFPFFSS
ncbi:MAG: hypothetical protein ACJA0Q_002235 [Saprospiraceae bacterium]|jgi:hypothetical protein